MDGNSLDASQLTDVMHLLVRLRLVPDLLHAGLRADALSVTMQELWLGEVVSANLPADAIALLDAGFALLPETAQDVRLKALRSDAWRDVERRITPAFGADEGRRRQLAWLHLHPTL
jgi:hypothetical protein